MEGERRGGKGGEEEEGRRPHPFTSPLIHISGYAPVVTCKTITTRCRTECVKTSDGHFNTTRPTDFNVVLI